jgi:hypothetical protein
MNNSATIRGLPPLDAIPVRFYLYRVGFWRSALRPGALSHFPVSRPADATGFVRSSSILAFFQFWLHTHLKTLTPTPGWVTNGASAQDILAIGQPHGRLQQPNGAAASDPNGHHIKRANVVAEPMVGTAIDSWYVKANLRSCPNYRQSSVLEPIAVSASRNAGAQRTPVFSNGECKGSLNTAEKITHQLVEVSSVSQQETTSVSGSGRLSHVRKVGCHVDLDQCDNAEHGRRKRQAHSDGPWFSVFCGPPGARRIHGRHHAAPN